MSEPLIDFSELTFDELLANAKGLAAELHMANCRIDELEGAVRARDADIMKHKEHAEIHLRRRCEKDETILAVINALRAGGEIDDE